MNSSPKGASGLGGPSVSKRRKSPPVLLSPSDTKTSKAAKTDKDHIYEFLPFETKREPVDLNKVIADINKKYRTNRLKKKNAVINLAQLFQDEKITMEKYTVIIPKGADYKETYKPMEIEIIAPLSLRDDTVLYIGKVLEGQQTGKNVVVKVQPFIPKDINIPMGFQVTSESGIMRQLQTHCKDILAPKAFAYGKINPLMIGDIERYVLVSELLGKDLSRALKNASVEHIKKV
jgi:hypothetical protein